MRSLLIGISLVFAAVANAQQLPQYSQYDFNKFIINPAVAGSESYVDLLLSHRSQWVGFEGAPTTQTFSGHALMPNETMGIGTYFFNDRTGPSKRMGVNLAYAYHLKFGSTFLGFGISGSYLQYSMDGSNITLSQSADNAISRATLKRAYPDAGFGMFYYGSNFHIGLSGQHLLENSIKVFDPGGDGGVKLRRHLYLLSGVSYEINDYITLEPSLTAEMVQANPLQVDVRARMIYQGFFYAGVGYRTGDAAILTLGAFIDEKLLIAYSYDLQLSAMRVSNSGSHEIVVGYKFDLNYFQHASDPRPKKRYNLRLKKK